MQVAFKQAHLQQVLPRITNTGISIQLEVSVTYGIASFPCALPEALHVDSNAVAFRNFTQSIYAHQGDRSLSVTHVHCCPENL